MDFVFFSLYTKIHGVQEKSPGFPGFFAGFFDKHSERGFLQIKAAAGVEHGIVLLLMPDYLLLHTSQDNSQIVMHIWKNEAQNI